MSDDKAGMPDCRAAFEVWYAEPGCKSLARSGDTYRLMQAHCAWRAWQSGWNTRADLASPSAERELAELKAALRPLCAEQYISDVALGQFTKHFIREVIAPLIEKERGR